MVVVDMYGQKKKGDNNTTTVVSLRYSLFDIGRMIPKYTCIHIYTILCIYSEHLIHIAVNI